MKSLLAASALVTLTSASAMADCCTAGNVFTVTNACNCFVMGDSTYGSPTCDSNDKTPDETVQCKLDYWRKEVTRRTKARDDAQSALDKANDRVRAFEQAAKH